LSGVRNGEDPSKSAAAATAEKVSPSARKAFAFASGIEDRESDVHEILNMSADTIENRVQPSGHGMHSAAGRLAEPGGERPESGKSRGSGD
jgi:hypothetical protein